MPTEVTTTVPMTKRISHTHTIEVGDLPIMMSRLTPPPVEIASAKTVVQQSIFLPSTDDDSNKGCRDRSDNQHNVEPRLTGRH